jgi:hypothetical protein
MFALALAVLLRTLSLAPDVVMDAAVAVPIAAGEHATVPALVTPGIGTSPSDPASPDFFSTLFSAVANHNWRYVAALVVILLTFLARKYLVKWNWVKSLEQGKWAWTLAVLGSALAALVTKLLSNTPLGGVGGVLSALAAGTFLGLAATGIVKGANEFTQPPASTPPKV